MSRALLVALGVTVLTGLLMSLASSVASAHVPTTDGTSTIRQDGSLVRYQLELDYDMLTKAAGLGKLPPGAKDAEREAFLEARRDELASYLADRVTVALDGVRCDAELEDTGITKRQKFLYARVLLIHSCPGAASGEFTVRYGVFSQADAIGADHTNIVEYQLGGASGSDVFDAGHHELRVGDTGSLTSIGRFVTLGVEHILLGIDHVLFLVLLLLGARGWRSVVRLATSFTVAHSVTLALAVLGWVHVPAQIVEPLIALSILYVAVENIARGESRHRTLVVFGFGLLHGLGFAGALSFTDDLGARLLGSLVSFNIGIEIGQLTVVLLVFPLLLLARRYSWSSVAQVGASTLFGVIGLVWFVERLLAPSAA
ncbi:HupE/UreJ family protein [Streptomyces xantholiticus]|uniref:HupE/UreJ family protein n=1 Tax=Streptomyces xantholiticus TaxID=68285 RepID=UPI0016742464|nr:HupE/UreJ family protein [Streptomyces xantholiticus]GGW72528.1 hypothetical protein GCM10010381_66560 [Streptomyces xantholiticus]